MHYIKEQPQKHILLGTVVLTCVTEFDDIAAETLGATCDKY